MGLPYIHSKDRIIIGKTGSAKCSIVEIQSMSRLPFCGMLHKTLYATKSTLDATHCMQPVLHAHYVHISGPFSLLWSDWHLHD